MLEKLSTKVLDHLGLVSGMCDELELVQQIDKHLTQDLGQREVSIGTLCKALIINGLGFTERRLYMVSSFFAGKPIELLLGKGVQAKHLNDTVIGRALDAIQAYGTTELFAQLCPVICKQLGLSTRYAHLDSTTFHLDGTYNSDSPPGDDTVLHLTKGYSRDHRPDLNQAVLNLITENQAGIPLHMEALHGNTSDKSSFKQTIEGHIERLQQVTHFDYLTIDSAGYTQENLQTNSSQVKWISRVPETIKACKELISSPIPLQSLQEGYKYAIVGSTYANIRQRWLVIYSQQAYEREIASLTKRYGKQNQKELQAAMRFEKEGFACRKDAQKATENLIKSLKTLQADPFEIIEHLRYRTKGRPKKGAVPEKVYTIKLRLSSPLAPFERLKASKGRFVLATNELDEDKLPDLEVLTAYKGQAKVEKGFRFLKDPQFVASSLFVKKPERVEALLFIMTLCLTVYAAIEYRIRQQLAQQQETLPNQLGKQVDNPTTRWIFELFIGIHVLYGRGQPIPLNIKGIHFKIIQLMGARYKKYYLIE